MREYLQNNCLAVKLTDICLFSQSHEGSYFLIDFLRGSNLTLLSISTFSMSGFSSIYLLLAVKPVLCPCLG